MGLLSQAGVNFGDETINFQVNIFFQILIFLSKRNGNLSVFGFGGLSKNLFNAKPESEWKEEKDRYTISYEGFVNGFGICKSI